MLTKRFLKNFKIRIITDQFIHARQTRTGKYFEMQENTVA